MQIFRLRQSPVRFFRRGGISVLFAWLTVLMLVFALVLTEAGRLSAVRSKQARAGYTAAKNLSAAYNRRLFERYGLMFYDGGKGQEEVRKTAVERDFVSAFMENAGKAAAPFLGSTSATAALTKTVSATDHGGELFVRSALAFYKYEGAASLLSRIREQLSIFGEGEKTREQFLPQTEMLPEAFQGHMAGPQNAMAQPLQAADLRYFKIPQEATDRGCFRIPPEVLLAGDPEGPGAADPGDVEDETADPEGAEEPYDPAVLEEKLSESVIGEKKRTEAKGVLGIVLPEGRMLSAYTFSKQGLPSREFGSEALPSEGLLKETLKKIVFNEYLLDHFPCFTETSPRTDVQYELEYVLYGEPSDTENLKTVVNRLMWMREGMNLLYLATDSEKRGKAEELAETLAGWTGEAAAVLVPIITAAILAAWAYGESLADVRQLLSGDRVPMMKDKDSWSTSLDGLQDILQGKMSGGDGGGSGLSYRDYLRLLLFLGNGGRHTAYAMDMIQLNMRETAPGFTLRSQLYAMEFHVEAAAGPLFTDLPLVRNLLGQQGFRKKEEYYFSASY